jgi:hypothetical protein
VPAAAQSQAFQHGGPRGFVYSAIKMAGTGDRELESCFSFLVQKVGVSAEPF